MEISSTKDKKQTAYQDTPIGKIPADWEVKRLGEVADIDKESLGANTPKDYLFDYISLSDIDSEDFNIQTTKQIFETAPSRARRIVKKGDILLSTVRPNLQSFSIIRDNVKDLIASTGFAIISCKNIYNEYLFQYIFGNSIQKQFHQLLVGSNYPAINSSDVKNLKIPLPPLPEQQRIAEVLSTWDQAIQCTEQLILQKEQRKKWLMQKLLTRKIRLKGFSGEWKKVRISDCLSRITNGITYDTEKTTGIPVTRIETISDGVINFNKIGFADPIERIEDYRLQKGDILYSHINSLAHIGKVAIYNSDVPLYHGMNLLLLRCNSKVDSNFLFQWLVSDNGRKKAISLAKKAVNQASINISELRNISISIPSLQEQTAIAEVLQAADEEIELLKAKAEKLKEQKKGLMQQLLTGRKRLNYDL